MLVGIIDLYDKSAKQLEPEYAVNIGSQVILQLQIEKQLIRRR